MDEHRATSGGGSGGGYVLNSMMRRCKPGEKHTQIFTSTFRLSHFRVAPIPQHVNGTMKGGQVSISCTAF